MSTSLLVFCITSRCRASWICLSLSAMSFASSTLGRGRSAVNITEGAMLLEKRTLFFFVRRKSTPRTERQPTDLFCARIAPPAAQRLQLKGCYGQTRRYFRCLGFCRQLHTFRLGLRRGFVVLAARLPPSTCAEFLGAKKKIKSFFSLGKLRCKIDEKWRR